MLTPSSYEVIVLSSLCSTYSCQNINNLGTLFQQAANSRLASVGLQITWGRCYDRHPVPVFVALSAVHGSDMPALTVDPASFPRQAGKPGDFGRPEAA